MSDLQSQPSLVVLVNSQKSIEYFRDRPLSRKQNEDLLAMEEKLDKGFKLGNQFIKKPSLQDKATFVANFLAAAIQRQEDANAALACAYLATRYGELKQIKVSNHDRGFSIQLIHDEEYREQVPLKFVPKTDLD